MLNHPNGSVGYPHINYSAQCLPEKMAQNAILEADAVSLRDEKAIVQALSMSHEMFCHLRANLRYTVNHNRQNVFAFTVRLVIDDMYSQ
jgi:hypothetical protein